MVICTMLIARSGSSGPGGSESTGKANLIVDVSEYGNFGLPSESSAGVVPDSVEAAASAGGAGGSGS